MTVHAEANVVAQAAKKGHSLDGSTVIVTSLFPCSNCAGLLTQAGVKRIITTRSDNERWIEDAEISKVILQEAGVEVIYVKNVEGKWSLENQPEPSVIVPQRGWAWPSEELHQNYE
jgi:deoxycytidylate deaminase